MKTDNEKMKFEISNLEFTIEDLKFDERGLIPAVVQDARTREVLTLAYMNAESIERTLNEGETWFWSRSRARLWHKGESSGNTQRLVEMRADCDGDALVALVEPAGPACHTGARSCFHRKVDEIIESENLEHVSRNIAEAASGNGGDNGDVNLAGQITPDLGALLAELYTVIDSRRQARPEDSYTAYLFNEGLDKILKKVGEESAETIIAAKNQDARVLTAEVSDLLYHLLVLLIERGITLDDVHTELARRREKRSRE